MPNSWEFKQSLFTKLSRSFAWKFWSNLKNHAELEGVTIELDGPFQTGTKGRTITTNSRQEWVLSEVIDEKRFVITGREANFGLSFAWEFEDEGTGVRMTHIISADGSDAEMRKWECTLHQMELNAPKSLERLVAELNRLSGDGPKYA
ncbi:MAG: hypothetical protein ACR2NU_02455 [Aeoliella sp.]